MDAGNRFDEVFAARDFSVKNALSRENSRLLIAIRAVAVWLVIIFAEILHGVARGILLVPIVGEFRSNQIGVLTGSIIIVVIAWAFVRWIGAQSALDLLLVGAIWIALTLVFELAFGRFVVGLSWERIAADFNPIRGGLFPLGLILMWLAPLIATEARKRHPD